MTNETVLSYCIDTFTDTNQGLTVNYKSPRPI